MFNRWKRHPKRRTLNPISVPTRVRENSLEYARTLSNYQVIAAAQGAPEFTFLSGQYVHRVARERGIELDR